MSKAVLNGDENEDGGECRLQTQLSHVEINGTDTLHY